MTYSQTIKSRSIPMKQRFTELLTTNGPNFTSDVQSFIDRVRELGASLEYFRLIFSGTSENFDQDDASLFPSTVFDMIGVRNLGQKPNFW